MSLCSTLSRALATAALLLSGASSQAQDALPPAVLAALQAITMSPDALAAVALPLFPGAAPWRHRASVAVQPGSTMKLVTSIVALDRLGPNIRGFTELRSAAPLVAGTLQGDLILKGGADPELGVAQFWALLVDLRQRGVTQIEGDLVLDRTLFRPARPDLGQPPFDDAPEFPYNVVPDALQLAGGLLPFEITSTPDGARANTVPPLPGIEITSLMQPTDTPCAKWDSDWKPAAITQHDALAQTTTRIELHGGFPRDCTQRVELQLVDRNQLTESLFRTLWLQLGGRWNGRVREGASPDGTVLLARRVSRPWGAILRHMNKTSDNVEARLLFLQLGVPGMAASPQSTTAELAAREVRSWFAENRIASAGLVLDNGSGLSRSERISPLQLASMLKVAHESRWAPELAMSLPVAGVDGSMRRRLKDSAATGWARLKTGTLRNVVALAGYVRDAKGRPWAVAMMINDDHADQARPVLDALVDSIARGAPPQVSASPSARPASRHTRKPAGSR